MKTLIGEGNTPLTISKSGKLWFKHEHLNPSGSFKDRESAHVFQTLHQSSIKQVSIASSGNAAISACLYGKYFGITVHCIVSSQVPAKKIQAIESLGGKIIQISGYYKDSYEWLIKNPISNAINITSGQFPDRELGNTPITKEIYAAGLTPDYIIVPVGNGSLLAGIHAGLSPNKKIPQLIGVEVKNFAPVAEAIRLEKTSHTIQQPPHSIADAGIAAQKAYCSAQCINALKATKGYMIEIEESEILPAMHHLLAEGCVLEPSSACILPAFQRLQERENLQSKTVLALLTGSGRK